MYSLVWFLALGNAWAALALHRRGFRVHLLALWIATGAAGLLTHYFFAFTWAACAGWLALRPGLLHRRVVWLGIALTALLLLPWYALVLPRTLTAWRLTDGWLYFPARHNRLSNLVDLPLSYFSGDLDRWYRGGDTNAPFPLDFAVALIISLLGRLLFARGFAQPNRRGVTSPSH
jgi:hypothetical protein